MRARCYCLQSELIDSTNRELNFDTSIIAAQALEGQAQVKGGGLTDPPPLLQRDLEAEARRKLCTAQSGPIELRTQRALDRACVTAAVDAVVWSAEVDVVKGVEA